MTKQSIISFAAAALAVCLMAVASGAEISPGEKAPAFTARAADGSTVALSSLKGKTVVLDWANYGCPFDHMHYSSGNIPRLQQKYTAKGVVWLSVMSSAPGKEGYYTQDELKMQDAKNNNHATYVLMDGDGKIGHLYDAKTTPHIFVIDSNGIVQYNGAIDSMPSTDPQTLANAIPYAANAIDAVIKGKTPNPAFIPPYGCSVKY